ncbi:MAG: hypothetical protein J3K34DRAFT_427693 [Monoraphidium minutum]|nr:MAG: hypothetical protein J3K34DRAFT_427693 [Monoraphidium minutum]
MLTAWLDGSTSGDAAPLALAVSALLGVGGGPDGGGATGTWLEPGGSDGAAAAPPRAPARWPKAEAAGRCWPGCCLCCCACCWWGCLAPLPAAAAGSCALPAPRSCCCCCGGGGACFLTSPFLPPLASGCFSAALAAPPPPSGACASMSLPSSPLMTMRLAGGAC